MKRTYSELIQLPTFEERYNYLRLDGKLGEETFGVDRWINQMLYRSFEWRRLRYQIIARDAGCDLAVEGLEIPGKIIVHHMNPIDVQDIMHSSDNVLDPESLICTSLETHNAIHYGFMYKPEDMPAERTPNDTCPWK